jgi:hypothetical protein
VEPHNSTTTTAILPRIAEEKEKDAQPKEEPSKL